MLQQHHLHIALFQKAFACLDGFFQKGMKLEIKEIRQTLGQLAVRGNVERKS
jgi:hypothetical protein